MSARRSSSPRNGSGLAGRGKAPSCRPQRNSARTRRARSARGLVIATSPGARIVARRAPRGSASDACELAGRRHERADRGRQALELAQRRAQRGGDAGVERLGAGRARARGRGAGRRTARRPRRARRRHSAAGSAAPPRRRGRARAGRSRDGRPPTARAPRWRSRRPRARTLPRGGRRARGARACPACAARRAGRRRCRRPARSAAARPPRARARCARRRSCAPARYGTPSAAEDLREQRRRARAARAGRPRSPRARSPARAISRATWAATSSSSARSPPPSSSSSASPGSGAPARGRLEQRALEGVQRRARVVLGARRQLDVLGAEGHELLEGRAAPGERRPAGLVGQRHRDRRAGVDGERLDGVALDRA